MRVSCIRHKIRKKTPVGPKKPTSLTVLPADQSFKMRLPALPQRDQKTVRRSVAC